MKTIGIVTSSKSLLPKHLRHNLEQIFSGFLRINNHYANDMQPEQAIDDDVIIAMTPEKAIEVKRFVADCKKIVVARRTIKGSEMHRIISIPAGLSVLVVNDSKETTAETVSLFYNIGINHLNLVPFEDGHDYHGISICITPGESYRVPANIKEISDVGHRCFDLSTFIEILSKLNINSPVITRRLIQYSQQIVPLDTGVSKQYHDLITKGAQLNFLMDLANEGIIITSNDKKIIMVNNKAANILGVEQNSLTDKKLSEVFPANLMKVFTADRIHEDVIDHNNKKLVVNGHPIEYIGTPLGMYFGIQDVSQIKLLEQNLSRKLRDKGFVARHNFTDIKAVSSSMVECIEMAKTIAKSDLTVLITGDSGTGKELFAQSIHNFSSRKEQPFVAVNCAALPESLLESELFGYEGGAFTGALKEGKKGLFEQAHNGTIFLDEIGDMPLVLQARLLRVLQERQVMRLGSDRLITVNVRIIAATNSDLLGKVNSRQFRKDLYYRLSVLPIHIPALINRKDDILPLFIHFLSEYGNYLVDDEVAEVFSRHDWPGNAREVQNVAAYAALVAGERITASDLPAYLKDGLYDYAPEYESLAAKQWLEPARAVLEHLKRFPGGTGRQTLAAGLGLSESEVRHVVGELGGMDLVRTHRGRKGTILTGKGEHFLGWLQSKSHDSGPTV